MENRNFLKWVRSEADRSVQIISGVSILSWFGILGLFLYNHLPLSLSKLGLELGSDSTQQLRGLLAIIHAATCFILVLATPRPKPNKSDSSPDSYITAKASRRIQILVISLFGSLTIYYAIDAYFTLSFSVNSLPHSAYMWEEIFETLNATLIFFLYVELADLTVTLKEETVIDLNRNTDALRHKLVFTIFAALLIVLSILSSKHYSSDLQVMVRLTVACLSGVTLALVIGRLGSIYINPGAGVLFFLHLYAVIQAYATNFAQPSTRFIATTVALPLKVLLWLVFVWAFTSGKLWEYVQEIRDHLEKQDGGQQRVS